MSNGMIRWTPEQFEIHKAARAATQKIVQQDARKKQFQALGRLPKGKMNKTEQAYAALLDEQKRQGLILDYRFHAIRVRLADNTFYEVDFLVIDAGLGLAIHEVKGGFTTDKGQLKIKLCAEALPWLRCIKVTKQTAKQGGGWEMHDFY
nr:MAG TPA: Endonuclease [Caudoviricetes sp.]